MSKEQYSSIYEGIGKIIFKTSSVHFLAAQIISYYYSGNNDNRYRISLIHDILTNEHTSLAFIANSLKRVLLNLGFDKKPIEKIKSQVLQISNLRNRFAHEVLLYNNDTHYFSDRNHIPWRGEGLKFEDEFKNFENLYNEITNNLNKIIKNKNIKIIDQIPNGYEPPKQAFDS